MDAIPIPLSLSHTHIRTHMYSLLGPGVEESPDDIIPGEKLSVYVDGVNLRSNDVVQRADQVYDRTTGMFQQNFVIPHSQPKQHGS